MKRKLLVALSVVLLSASLASAGDLSDAEVLELAGPRTCNYGYFPYIDKEGRNVTIPVFTLDPGILYEYCFKLRKATLKHIGTRVTNGLVTLQTSNLGNSSCGTMSAFLIRPNRKTIFGPNAAFPRTDSNLDSAQPAGVLPYTRGVWRVLFRYEGGCNQYSVIVSW